MAAYHSDDVRKLIASRWPRVVVPAIEAVSPGQMKAALALGFRPGQAMRVVVLPQALVYWAVCIAIERLVARLKLRVRPQAEERPA